jgi:hypothetical protein
MRGSAFSRLGHRAALSLKFLMVALLAALTTTLGACSGGEMAKISAWGQPHAVYAYSGNALIGRWIATGKIENEAGSDGYYFKDKQTGRLQQMSGSTIMDPITDAEADSLIRAWGPQHGRLDPVIVPGVPASTSPGRATGLDTLPGHAPTR